MAREHDGAAEADINSGTLGGFNGFCSWLIERGGMKSGAIEPLRSATNQIIATVDGDAANALDLRDVDVDEYLGRFENKAGHKYSANSLRAYRSRFARAIELYRRYLEQGAGNFRPPTGRATRRRATGPSDSRAGADAGSSVHAPGTPGQAALVDFPFPLKSGHLAHLYLPQRLEKDDAERMAAFVRALVLDPQRQIAAGGKREP